MTDAEIKSLLKQGTVTTYSFDPQHRQEITRQNMDTAVREVKRHLAAKKTVTLLIVRG